MRSRRGMKHAGEYIAETGRSHAQLQRVHKTKSRCAGVVFQFDRHQSAELSLAQNARCYFLIAVSQLRKIYATDSRIILQILRQRARWRCRPSHPRVRQEISSRYAPPYPLRALAAGKDTAKRRYYR